MIHLIKPVASIKKLSLTFGLAPEVPVCAFGDEKRLMQTILNVVGNAVKFTKEGYISVTASVARPESLRDWRASDFYPVMGDGHFYLRVQVDYISLHHCQLYLVTLCFFLLYYYHSAKYNFLLKLFKKYSVKISLLLDTVELAS